MAHLATAALSRPLLQHSGAGLGCWVKRSTKNLGCSFTVGLRRKWDASDRYLRMRVQSEDVNFGKLARGLLHRMELQLQTDVDAMGDQAVSNAVKAAALANAFADKDLAQKLQGSPTDLLDAAAGLAFIPRLVSRRSTGQKLLDSDEEQESEEELLKLVRLSLVPLARHGRTESRDYGQGGIYVPTSPRRSVGEDGAASSGDAAAAAEDKVLSPRALARQLLDRWRLFVASPDSPSADSESEPFLLTRGPAPLARAVRALALARVQLQKERPKSRVPLLFAVEPCLWHSVALFRHRPAKGASDQGGGSHFVVLRLLLREEPDKVSS
ncbi:unnamed protein product [Polarella glacialis]|uniref:Uncharacterized protein n=1 Tax=Polarella glacialis TaxID=89957 RepID=A0A813IN64_POLGL|nr:unnamed protein product [Polarella glacialis]